MIDDVNAKSFDSLGYHTLHPFIARKDLWWLGFCRGVRKGGCGGLQSRKEVEPKQTSWLHFFSLCWTSHLRSVLLSWLSSLI